MVATEQTQYGITDLIAISVVLLMTALAVLLEAPALVRVPLALVTVLFLPGYALAAALFPARDQVATGGLRSITRLERAALSVGFSITLVPMAALLLDVLSVPLTTETLLGTVLGLTFALLGAAAVRRRQLPADARYAPAFDRSRLAGMDKLTLVLVLSLVFAGAAIAYPQADAAASTTEFYLLTEDEDGALQAADYPTEFPAGESQSLSVAIGNRGTVSTSYTVVGQLQRAEMQDNETVVEERQQITERSETVPANDTTIMNETVTVSEPGNYRLVYLLYRGEPPAEPRIDNAYRELHLWINVSSPTGVAT